VRARDDLDGDDFADSFGGIGAGIDGGLQGGDIAAEKGGDVARSDRLVTGKVTLAALRAASAASRSEQRPLVSIMPRAS